MKELKQLRKDLKKLGVKVKTGSNSLGRFAEFETESKQANGKARKLNSIFLGREDLLFWQETLDILKEYKGETYHNGEKIIF